MTLAWFIFGCLALMTFLGVMRRRPGEALTNLIVLICAFAIIAVADLLVSQFVYTRNVAMIAAALLALAYALDAVHGAISPQGQRARNRKLRGLLHRRAA